MSDNQEAEPQNIEDILDAAFSEPDEPTETQEETPQEVNEEVDTASEESSAEETEEQNVNDEPTDPEQAEQEPQHLDLEDYGDATIPIIVDGTETKVNLRDAVKGYQLQADYSRKTAALADDRRQMDADLEQGRAELADKQRLLDEQLAHNIEQEPDWEAMARDNPLEYLPAKEKWLKQQSAHKDAQTRSQQATEAQTMEFRQRTAEVALRSMPDWATDEGFAKNAHGRMTVALDAGFTEAEYNGAVDYRLAVVLEKASLYDAMQAKNTVAAKKLAVVPKVLRPGKSKSKVDVQVANSAAVNRKLNQPHSMNDALNAYMDRQAG